jgi:integrase/recombinase XerD
LFVVIVDEFLDWSQKHRAPDTYRWYKDRLESFCKTIDPALPWTNFGRTTSKNGWTITACRLKSGSRRNLIRSVKRAMKWAEEQGYIDHSPIAHMKKPAADARSR